MYSGVSFAARVPLGDGTNSGTSAVSDDDNRTGWTVGGGLEWMFAPNWSLKVDGKVTTAHKNRRRRVEFLEFMNRPSKPDMEASRVMSALPPKADMDRPSCRCRAAIASDNTHSRK
jgi:hypothetical protein